MEICGEAGAQIESDAILRVKAPPGKSIANRLVASVAALTPIGQFRSALLKLETLFRVWAVLTVFFALTFRDLELASLRGAGSGSVHARCTLASSWSWRARTQGE